MFMLQIRKEFLKKIILSHYLIMVIQKKNQRNILLKSSLIQIQNIVLVEFSVQQIATKKKKLLSSRFKKKN